MGMYENPPYYLSTYALAVKRGFKGTEDEWLKSLQGPEGKPGGDAYQVAVSQGFEGTVVQWLESLRGPKGPQGPQGECDAFYVLITQDGATKTADKTFAEMMTAYEAARPIYGLITQTDVLNLVHVDPDAFVFQGIVGAVYQRVIIRSNNTVAYTSEKYVVTGDLLSPLYVTLSSEGGAYLADTTFEEIQAAHQQGRDVYCFIGNSVCYLYKINSAYALFRTADGAVHHQITIWSDDTVTYDRFEYALAEDLRPSATDEIYFGITDDGTIYLKPEYRGGIPTSAASSATYKYAVSDNGAEVAGSKVSELPENIVIPDMIGETPVNKLTPGMFMCNPTVKRVILPSCVTEIPNNCFYKANQLMEISGTEQVTSIGSQAFTETNIQKAICPNLQTISGNNTFALCLRLCVADIGKVDAIPNGCFQNCGRLHTVRGGKNVDTVGKQSFINTTRLKNPAFIPNLTDIGDYGFLYSRVYYTWASLTDCSFGANATALQFNPVDYWSARDVEPCSNPIRSTFDQSNPLWANDEILPGQMTWGEGGCTMCSDAVIYSAYEGKDLASPAEFVAAAIEKDPTLIDLTIGYKETTERYLEAVGYTVETKNAAGEELTVGNDLQYMYDALAQGHLVLMACAVGKEVTTGHVVVVYGINENRELLIVDSNGMVDSSGVYKANIFAMPVQNITKEDFDFSIVRKN